MNVEVQVKFNLNNKKFNSGSCELLLLMTCPSRALPTAANALNMGTIGRLPKRSGLQ
jgi:hypothetical protein